LIAAVAYYLLGAGLILLHPVDGQVAVVLRSRIGGSMARRPFPVLFLVPVMGFVATRIGGHDLALVLLLLLVNFGLAVLIWTLATTLEEAEGDKKRAFEHIESLNHELNSQVVGLLSTKDQATAAVKTRSQFVANVSHESRTPLSGIIGLAELLQDTKLDQNQRYSRFFENGSANTATGKNDFEPAKTNAVHISTR
jgi:signal transduction histidine kinase